MPLINEMERKLLTFNDEILLKLEPSQYINN